jgi:hypothetical protein
MADFGGEQSRSLELRSGSRASAPGSRRDDDRCDLDPTGRLIVTGGVDGTVRTYLCAICGIDDLLQWRTNG